MNSLLSRHRIHDVISMTLSRSFIKHIEADIQASIKIDVPVDRYFAVAGGDICQSYQIISNNQSYFLKCHSLSAAAIFTAEVRGLAAIAATNTITTPRVIAHGTFAEFSYLLLNYYEINNHGDEFLLGQQLALMHQHGHHQFGFDNDNFIGLTPQKNTWHSDWADFWISNRLRPQLALAGDRDYGKSLTTDINQLIKQLPEILGDHQPSVSLVHGDLWGGNKGFSDNGEPIIFDPACYYGDREVDIAMSRLFGGFSEDFYRGYYDIWPLPDGYQQRQVLYNLYHQLNHLQLFGRGYLAGCLHSLSQLLRH